MPILAAGRERTTTDNGKKCLKKLRNISVTNAKTVNAINGSKLNC